MDGDPLPINNFAIISYEALSHVMEVIQVPVEHLSEILSGGCFLLQVDLHGVNVVGACADVVGDSAHLLHPLSEDAVESEAGLKQADITLPEAELAADLSSELGQLLVVGADFKVGILHVEGGVLLAVHSSEHLCDCFIKLFIIIQCNKCLYLFIKLMRLSVTVDLNPQNSTSILAAVILITLQHSEPSSYVSSPQSPFQCLSIAHLKREIEL